MTEHDTRDQSDVKIRTLDGAGCPARFIYEKPVGRESKKRRASEFANSIKPGTGKLPIHRVDSIETLKSETPFVLKRSFSFSDDR